MHDLLLKDRLGNGGKQREGKIYETFGQEGSMDSSKAILIVGLTAVVIFAWMFRYEYVASATAGQTRHDRWSSESCVTTGAVIGWICADFKVIEKI